MSDEPSENLLNLAERILETHLHLYPGFKKQNKVKCREIKTWLCCNPLSIIAWGNPMDRDAAG